MKFIFSFNINLTNKKSQEHESVQLFFRNIY
jgi:hypothetical protein